MIEAKQVVKSFGQLRALDNVTLNCYRGECIALIGPNGSGKTTFIKSVLGMVVPDSGDIMFKGQTIKGNWKYRNEIGYMPQIGRYPENMTIGQVMLMMKDIRKGSTLDEELIEAFQLGRLLEKRMGTLSGGTRQKVSACLAFLFNSDLLVLDEPTAGLDPVSAEVLKTKILAEKAKGKLILITSHILSDLDDLVSEVIYLQDGKLAFHKKIEALKSETNETKLSKAIARVMLNNSAHE